jgi:hypothetical protein
MNETCAETTVPVGEPCARCDEPIGAGEPGVMMWHVKADMSGQYRPLHYACFMRQSFGGIDHVVRHGRGRCDGKCAPDPEWLSRRRAAEIATELWQAAGTEMMTWRA